MNFVFDCWAMIFGSSLEVVFYNFHVGDYCIYMNHIKKNIRYIDNITRRSGILWLVIRKWYLMIYNLMIIIETPAAAHSKTWIFLSKGTQSTPNISHTYMCILYIWLCFIIFDYVWLCFIATYGVTNSNIFTFLHFYISFNPKQLIWYFVNDN